MNSLPPASRFVRLSLFIVLAFLCGVALEREGWLPGAASEPPGVRKTFAPFWEAWALVDDHYVDRKSIDPKKMTQFAILGMLDSLGDEGHTTYLRPEDVKQMESGLKGEMEGIGARISMKNRNPTILNTMPNSPARKAGLKPGDVLLQVNDDVITRESLQKIVAEVRGPAGTEVKLRVHREGQAEPVDLTITRGKVEVPDVSWHMAPGEKIAHIGIESFGDQADTLLQATLMAAVGAGAKGVILDLRGNPGGLKDQAVKVTSEFLKNGDVFIDQDMKGKQTAVPVTPGGMALDMPLCVLIDQGTASAAEITAGALQDHERAKLVGQKTFGTGTVLQPYPLSDGGELLLATSEWLTPKGRQIWHEGIKPDVEVALPEMASGLLPEMEDDLDAAAFQKTEDVQLLKALEVLKKQIEGKGQEGK